MMKKQNLKISTLWMMLGLLPSIGFAQNFQPNAPVPLDKAVTHGTLSNGMQYYIRANQLPEKRAEFYIVHNVGAILEEDNQNGLAHFTEHMAFNGTKNFPKKALLNYLETIGCKFGQNVNAFTAQDVTCYNISSVPVERQGVIDSCLLILHDWSNYISFDADEIESERGVIREEWRTRGGAQARLSDKIRPIIFSGSKYGQRNVIGDTAVINHFEHDAIFDFYHKWYRPDLQAVIVVGDIDVAQMEEKIKTLFSTIPAVSNPVAKPVYDIPDNSAPIVALATDPEATSTNIKVFIKHPAIPNAYKVQGYLRFVVVRSLINQMMNVRMSDILQKESAPCMNANTGYSSFTATKDVFMATATAKTGQALPSLEMLLTESKRMQQFGFTPSELERAKANFLRSVESQYLDREKQEHNSFVWDYFSHFTNNEPACDIEYFKDFANEVVPGISIEEINAIASQFVTDKNIIISLTAPDQKDIQVPDTTQLLAVYDKVKNMTVTGYENQLTATSLMDTLPAKGNIVKESFNKKMDATEWTLSNGIKVVLKKTNFKEDEVQMNAHSMGGTSQIADSCLLTAWLTPSLMNEMGLGKFSSSDLRKVMAGKMASTGIGLSDDKDIVSGHCSPNDIEWMLQQINLRFTAPRFDREAYNAFMARVQTSLQFRSLNPDAAFGDSVNVMINNHHPRALPISAARLSEMSFEKLEAIYRDRFADPASFTFLFVGNIDKDTLKPLLETYLASLPTGDRKEKYIDRGERAPKVSAQNHFSKEMQTPKTSVFAYYPGQIKYTLSEMVMLNAIKNILDIRYVASIREKEGGSYGVRVSASYAKQPEKKAHLMMSFTTDPAKTERMVQLLHGEVDTLLTQGPKEEDVVKTREFFLKSFADQQKENGYWMGVLTNHYIDKIDKTTQYVALVNKLDAKSIQQFAAKTFSKNLMLEVVMEPVVTSPPVGEVK